MKKPVISEKQNEIKARRMRIVSLLKRGYTPSSVIQRIMEEYNLSYGRAYVVVYEINSELNKTNTELMEDAKNYIINALLGTIEDCNDINDVKSKLIALKHLSDVTKVTEDKAKDINIQFSFDK